MAFSRLMRRTRDIYRLRFLYLIEISVADYAANGLSICAMLRPMATQPLLSKWRDVAALRYYLLRYIM